MPVAELKPSSGIIHTADFSKAFVNWCPTTVDPTAMSATDGSVDSAEMPTPKAATTDPARAPATGTPSPDYPDELNAPTVNEGVGETKKGVPSDPRTHPSVLADKRVWVVSPVVGWASVWAFPKHRNLIPADVEDTGDDKAEGDIKAGDSAEAPPAVGVDATVETKIAPGGGGASSEPLLGGNGEG